ncbi:MAG: hypothetical protein JWN62_3038 [Acidimicrobiales bacterium]|nr:hypothetical protein [Acidimicrobiales bacterium]
MSPLEGNRLLDRLEQGETVQALAKSIVTDGKAGLFVVTTTRVFSIWATMRSAKIVRPIMLDVLTSVEVLQPTPSHGSGDAVLIVRGPTVEERFTCFAGWQSAAAVLERLVMARIAAPPLPAGSAGTTAAELERIADLWRSGVLTDIEFTAAKAKVLGLD